jgi:Tfp pilus assembly protein PilP
MSKHVAVLCLAIAGCGVEVDAAGAAPGAVPVSSEVHAASVTQSVPETLPEDAFVESEQHRDPFRPFDFDPLSLGPGAFCDLRARRRASVRMADTPVASMELIATVSGVADPTAMVADERGVGHAIRRGDFLGADELVSHADGMTVSLQWRVERIEPERLVLVREDPSCGAITSRVLVPVAISRVADPEARSRPEPRRTIPLAAIVSCPAISWSPGPSCTVPR